LREQPIQARREAVVLVEHRHDDRDALAAGRRLIACGDALAVGGRHETQQHARAENGLCQDEGSQ
jgi:hypothetical protein